MPSIETRGGTIFVRPSAHGYRATFHPYPTEDWIDEEESDEEGALRSLHNTLDDIHTEVTHSIQEYINKQRKHREKLEANAKKRSK